MPDSEQDLAHQILRSYRATQEDHNRAAARAGQRIAERVLVADKAATAERQTNDRELDWQRLIETATTMPGSVGSTYRRFYNYSTLNVVYLMMQGLEPEPIATYNRWKALGRQVVRGAKAKEIIRPIQITKKDDNGDVETVVTKFKGVRCIFPLSMTTGEPLPPFQAPRWSYEAAKTNLDINEIPFAAVNGNMQGYSFDRNMAINPVAAFPNKTRVHEMAHIVLGHTVEDMQDEYQEHRGLYEFGAETTAFLTLTELEMLSPEAAQVSRGYVQGWLRGQKPDASSIRSVFHATDTILRAGLPQVPAHEAA